MIGQKSNRCHVYRMNYISDNAFRNEIQIWPGLHVHFVILSDQSPPWNELMISINRWAVLPDAARVCCLKPPSLCPDDISPSSLPSPFALCLLSTFSSLPRRTKISSVLCFSSACCSHKLPSKTLAISHTAAASSESMTAASWAWKALLADSIVFCFGDNVLKSLRLSSGDGWGARTPTWPLSTPLPLHL